MNALQTPPAGVAAANELIARLDDCLLHGCARLGPEQHAGLAELAVPFAGAPLADPLHEALEALGRSEFLVRHFQTLAAARAALQGAQYDALRAQANDALGRSAPTPDYPAPVTSRNAAALASTQQWLQQVALNGFRHLQEDAVLPFAATLEPLQQDPAHGGLAALLTGFVNELLAHMPMARRRELPAFRWADLWTAAFVRTLQVPGETPFVTVAGALTPLGVSSNAHANVFSATLYGLLERDGEPACTVRLPLHSYKVDALNGVECWELFGDAGEAILRALAERRQLRLGNAELQTGGDLRLLDAPSLGAPADPLAAGEQLTALPALPPLLRHPLHIDEAVCLQAGHGLPIARRRLPEGSEMTDKLLDKAPAQIGLLRFDRGRWELQPLCAQGGKGPVLAGESLAAARARLKSKTLSILRERAGKLLRAA